MNVIFDEFAGQVVPIRLHTWWPAGGDCFWLFNEPEIEDRLVYYDTLPPWPDGGSYYVPSFRFEGTFIADPSDSQFITLADWYAFVRNTLDSLAAIPSPLRIANFTQTPGLDSVHVSFDVVADDSVYVMGELRLNLIVTEWRYRCPFPVGAHDHVFRDYLHGFDGYPITMQIGDSLHFDWAYYVDDEYRTDRLVTNLYVEDYPNFGMVQGYREEVPPEYAGVDAAGDAVPVSMEPASPNPFSSTTRIAFSMKQAGNVRLSVYTPEGRLVSDVVDEPMGPGYHHAVWDGCDRSGNKMGSGIYYYRLVTGDTVLTGKMILLR
jgi:hypothetical protein